MNFEASFQIAAFGRRCENSETKLRCPIPGKSDKLKTEKFFNLNRIKCLKC